MPRKAASTIRSGRRAEDLARHHLQQAGLRLLQRNFRCSRGEIDLVMRDGDSLVFVEVRYRRRDRCGSGAESVDRRKQARIVACARYFLLCHPRLAERPARFDVVAVSGGEPMPGFRVDWIRDAFRVDE